MSAVSRPLAVAAISATLGIIAVVRLVGGGEDRPAPTRPVSGRIAGALGAVRIGQPSAVVAGNPMTAPPLVDTLRMTRRALRPVRCADGEVRFRVGYTPALGAGTPEAAVTRFEGMPLAAQMSDAFFKEISRRRRLVRYRILDPDGAPIGVARVGLGQETAWHVLALRTCAM